MIKLQFVSLHVFFSFNRTPYRNQPSRRQQQSFRRRPMCEKMLSYVVYAILILITMFAVYLIFRNELWTRYNVSTLFCFLNIVGIWKLKINGKLTKNICWNYYLCKSANQLASKNPVLGIRSQFKIPFREMPCRELPKCEWNVSGSDVSL